MLRGAETKAEHREYLWCAQWKAFRAGVFAVLRRKCRLCRSTEDVSVHRKAYEIVHSGSRDSMAVLCDWCPAKHHESDVSKYAFWPVVRLSDGHLYQGREMRRVD